MIHGSVGLKSDPQETHLTGTGSLQVGLWPDLGLIPMLNPLSD